MNLILRRHNGFPHPLSFRRSAFDQPFNRLIDSMIEDYFVPALQSHEPIAISPQINLSESSKGYEVEAELPGVTKENIKISVEGKRISIEAKIKRASERKEGEQVIREERVIKKFARSFLLSDDIDESGALAKLENGLLTLNLPKKSAPQARRITVQ
jgi:HSP20 family protein